MQEWDEILLEIMQWVVVEVFGFSISFSFGLPCIVAEVSYWQLAISC